MRTRNYKNRLSPRSLRISSRPIDNPIIRALGPSAVMPPLEKRRKFSFRNLFYLGRSAFVARSTARLQPFSPFPEPWSLGLAFLSRFSSVRISPIKLAMSRNRAASILSLFPTARPMSKAIQLLVKRHNIFACLRSLDRNEIVTSSSSGTVRIYAYSLNRLFAGSKSTSVHHTDFSSQFNPPSSYVSWFFRDSRRILRDYLADRQLIRRRIRIAYKRSRKKKGNSPSSELSVAKSSDDSGFFKKFFVLRARDRSTSIVSDELGFYFFDRLFFNSQLENLSVFFHSLSGLPKIRAFFRGLRRRSKQKIFMDQRRNLPYGLFSSELARFFNRSALPPPISRSFSFHTFGLFSFKNVPSLRSFTSTHSLTTLHRLILLRLPRQRISPFRPGRVSHRFSVRYRPSLLRSRPHRGPKLRRV